MLHYKRDRKIVITACHMLYVAPVIFAVRCLAAVTLLTLVCAADTVLQNQLGNCWLLAGEPN